MHARLLLALAFAAASCGRDPAPATRVRLWTLATAELTEAPRTDTARTVFAEDWTQGRERWTEIHVPGLGPGGFAAHTESEADGPGFARLEGDQGGLHVVVPVEPSTCYALTGKVRARGGSRATVDPSAATVWFAEASERSTFQDLFTTRRDLLIESGSLATTLDHADWQERSLVFVTTPRTRFLHVVCSLASAEDGIAGSVDFAGVRVEATTLEAHWRTLLQRETALRIDVDPPAADWQRARRVTAECGGESRPSIVLLPGERLRFQLPPLASGARLDASHAAWGPAWIAESDARAALVVRSSDPTGVELSTTETDHGDGDDRLGRWSRVQLALADGATQLEFEARGTTPVVIGAPVVTTATPRASGPNVLLVSIDTLRADHVGAYGVGDGHTPTLDRLAREGVLCRDASAQAPYTLPSHATLLTGQFPSVHGVVAHGRTLAAARSASLAEILGAQGFVTRAFTAGGFVNVDFGLDRGFEGFSAIDPIRGSESHYARELARRLGANAAEFLLAEQGFDAVERWLTAHRDERFFLFLHTYTVHDYDAPDAYLRCAELGCTRPRFPPRTRDAAEAAAFTPEMRAHVEHVYDAALRYTDERLGALLARLAELGLAENTLIAVTSDHGEEFFEHGALQHGRTLYEELLRVPLVFHGPGFAPRVIERPAMLVDVAPTLLARLGLPRDPRAQGVDLLGAPWPERPVWSEVDDRFAHKYALRRMDGSKTIHGPAGAEVQFPNDHAWENYDLRADPREQRDLGAGDDAARADVERVRRSLEEFGDSLGAAGHGAVDEGTLEELDELGYGGG